MSRPKAKNPHLARSGMWSDQRRHAAKQPSPEPQASAKPETFGGSYLDALREESRRNLKRLERK